MKVIIDESDLAQLKVQFPELDFTDPERKAVLTCMDSIDVQAAPGSGKTTLLAAKLALIASKWSHTNRGICVLSHTNVAREEIEQRLLLCPAGQQLLSYPHFIGTIQTFVHSFFSLPLLRSCGISPDVIEDDYFADRAMAAITNKWSVKGWHKNAPGKAEPVIRSLTFLGPELDIGCSKGTMPQSTAKSYQELCDIKTDLTSRGVFRYDDMFAFSEHVLANYPTIAEAVRHRFPLVFMDEMQDTSSAQEALLTKAFGASICIQRYGDVSQQILNDSDKDSPSSFPKNGFLSVTTSKRFGPAIAAVASRIRATGSDITGEGMAATALPTILVYENSTVQNVISSFGSYVAELFSAEELVNGSVKAICARKTGNSNKGVGRHVFDYFPAFDASTGKPITARPAFIDLIRDISKNRCDGEGLANATHHARTALLQVLRHAESPHATTARRWRDFIGEAEQNGVSIAQVTSLLRTYVLSPPSTVTVADWDTTKATLYEFLNQYLPPAMTEAQFCELSYLAYRDADAGAVTVARSRDANNRFRVVHAEKNFDIDISTIAGVKGETHLATLVLESFLQSKFDVTSALTYLCGEANSMVIAPSNLYKQMRSLYVGMTRPTRLLCFAIHRDRLTAEYEAKLLANGWVIRNCT